MKVITAVLCFSLIAAGGIARADAPDEIVLKDGTVLRGQVSEMRPKKSVTLRLLDGRTREITWSEIQAARGPAFPSSEKPAEEAEENVPKVPLVIESEKSQSITLHARSPIAVNGMQLSVTAEVCSSTPCKIDLPVGEYWVLSKGKGVTGAVTRIDHGSQGTHLRLRSGSSAMHGGGVALIITGAIELVIGAAVAGASVMSDYAGRPYFDSSTVQNMQIGGGAVLAIGAASLIAGSVMVHKSRGGVESQGVPASNRPSPVINAWVSPIKDGGAGGVSLRF